LTEQNAALEKKIAAANKALPFTKTVMIDQFDLA